jgi:hypothetical protein
MASTCWTMVSTSSCKFMRLINILYDTNAIRWIGRDAVPALLADVFGVEDRTQLKQGKASLPLLDNEYSERVRAGKSMPPNTRTLNCTNTEQLSRSRETTSRRA